MRIDVDLAGHSSAWEYRGCVALEEWLRIAPWLAGGGVQRARLRSEDEVAGVLDAIERLVAAIDGGRSGVRVAEILPDPADDLAEVVSCELGVDPHLRGSERCRRLSEELRRRPRLFVVVPGSADGVRRHAHRADALLDRLRVSDDPAPLAIVQLDATGELDAAVGNDFRTGLPPDIDLLDACGARATLWPAYLHYRIAWESGGDREAAAGCWRDVDLPPQTGDDRALEVRLTSWAAGRWEALGPSDREEAFAWSEARVGREPFDRSAAERLLDAGVLWRPAMDRPARLSAWAARAMLDVKPDGPCRQLLRGSMICAPLARSALDACFEIEIVLRSGIRASSVAGDTELEERYARFQSDDPGAVGQFYPEPCPARPRSPLAFTTLGKLAWLGEWGRRERQAILDLAALRNALAHGHYVSWRAVEILDSVRSLLV